MATVTDALDNVLREEISQGIREQRPEIDPVWGDIISTSFGVERTGMGRDWQFNTAFVTGSAGAFEFMGTPGGPTITGGDVDYTIFGGPQGFPGRRESTAPAFFLRTVTLKEGRGNVYVPIKWHTLDRADGAVGSAVKAVITGLTRKVARAYALAFFTKDATSFAIVDDLPVSASAATHTITIDNADSSKASGRIQMLENGAVVDIYDKDDAIVNEAAVGKGWVVTKVDFLAQTFDITKIDGANKALDKDTSSEGKYLVLRGSRDNQCSGLNTWIKKASDSPTVFGIVFANHPEFGSLIETQVGPLTEKYLRNRIGAFIDRIGTMVDLDTILTPAGVVHAYMENEDNIMTIERNGRLLEMNHGWADIKFSYHGKPFRWAISTFTEPKSLYVIKLAGANIKEYLPPKTPGMGASTEFGDVEFAGPAGGLSGIWAHELLTGAETASPFGQDSGIGDNLQAPFWRLSELAPEQMQSIKTTGFDEA